MQESTEENFISYLYYLKTLSHFKISGDDFGPLFRLFKEFNESSKQDVTVHDENEENFSYEFVSWCSCVLMKNVTGFDSSS